MLNFHLISLQVDFQTDQITTGLSIPRRVNKTCLFDEAKLKICFAPCFSLVFTIAQIFRQNWKLIILPLQ